MWHIILCCCLTIHPPSVEQAAANAEDCEDCAASTRHQPRQNSVVPCQPTKRRSTYPKQKYFFLYRNKDSSQYWFSDPEGLQIEDTLRACSNWASPLFSLLPRIRASSAPPSETWPPAVPQSALFSLVWGVGQNPCVAVGLSYCPKSGGIDF